MPTKTELEEQVAALVDELAQKQEIITDSNIRIKRLEEQIVALMDELATKKVDLLDEAIEERDARIEELEAKFAKEVSDDITKILDRSCINCGMNGRTTYDAESERFVCAFCGYQWGMEAEQAPFRRQRPV